MLHRRQVTERHNIERTNRLMHASLGWLADRRERARTVLLSPGEPSRTRCCLVYARLPGPGCRSIRVRSFPRSLGPVLGQPAGRGMS